MNTLTFIEDNSMEGRICLVTGASRGIGLAIAERLVAEGARVCITARTRQTLDEAVEQLQGHALEQVGRDAEGDAAVAFAGDGLLLRVDRLAVVFEMIEKNGQRVFLVALDEPQRLGATDSRLRLVGLQHRAELRRGLLGVGTDAAEDLGSARAAAVVERLVAPAGCAGFAVVTPVVHWIDDRRPIS